MADVLTNLDFKSVSRILNLPSPTDPNEPARLADLNSAIEGLAWKDSARVATQGNINLSSPGATIDGITLSSGDRVLVKSQTSQAENGIYVFNGASTPMTRSADASTSSELEQAVVTVEEGSSAGVTYRQTQVNFTLGTDPVLWTTFGTSVPQASETTAGIAEIATQAETDAGTDDQRIVTPLKLTNWAGRIRKYTTTIGDGSATSFNVTHNFNTRDVIVQVYYSGGTYDQVYCDVKATTTNMVQLLFSSAPAVNSLRVIVLA
jgi:hypothetical protein